MQAGSKSVYIFEALDIVLNVVQKRFDHSEYDVKHAHNEEYEKHEIFLLTSTKRLQSKAVEAAAKQFVV